MKAAGTDIGLVAPGTFGPPPRQRYPCNEFPGPLCAPWVCCVCETQACRPRLQLRNLMMMFIARGGEGRGGLIDSPAHFLLDMTSANYLFLVRVFKGLGIP